MIEPLETRIAPAALFFVKQLANLQSARDVVATDAQGNVLVAGVFTPNINADFATAPTVPNTTDPLGDVFIAKYSASGTLLWAQSWGGRVRRIPRRS